jgi:TolB-like protein
MLRVARGESREAPPKELQIIRECVALRPMATLFAFGPFRLDAEARLLLHGAEPLPLGQRAVALLGLLLARAGAPVGKEALIEAAWPGLAVEDSNLTVQIAALRRALAAGGGEAWIETLPRRGYRYVGPPAQPLASPEPPALPELPSVAVLPFTPLGGDPEQAAFADGIVEDIIAGLARLKGLFVIARSSSFAFRGREDDPRRIGQALGVRYLVQGSLRRQERRLRLATQLIEAETGRLVWAERYDRPIDDVFVLQDEIAIAVVGAIEPSLRRAEAERVRRKRPDSLDAYELVLRAQPEVDTGMPGPVRRALPLLARALEISPGYALAHGLAAMCHHCLFLRDGLADAERAASLHHAEAAIAHGRDDALALTFAGFSIGMDGHDRDAALSTFEAALAVSPSSALTRLLGSTLLGWAGEAERAIDWGERGLRLSPFDSWAFAAHHGILLGHFQAGRDAAAAEAAQAAVRCNPAHSISHMLLAACLARLGRAEAARAAAGRVEALQPGFTIGRQLSGVDCAPGLAEALRRALDGLGLPA